MSEDRGYQYNGIDVGTIISLEAQRLNHKFNVLKERIAHNKTGLDYIARSAVGVGNAGAYVVDGIFKVPAFLLRGGYKLAEGAGKLLVGLAPTLLNAYVANLQSKAQQAQQNRQNQQTPPPVPPQAGGPQPQPQPRSSNPQGPQTGSYAEAPQVDPFGYGFGGMQGMNRVNSPNITTNPTDFGNPQNYGNVSAENIGNSTNTFSPVFEPKFAPNFNNTYSPHIHIHLGSEDITGAQRGAGVPKVKETQKKAKPKRVQTVKRTPGKKSVNKKPAEPLYGLYNNGEITPTTQAELGQLEKKLGDIRTS